MLPGPRLKDEGGSVTIENVIILPLVLTFVFGIVQGGLWMHAQNVAHRAASAAFQDARVQKGDPGAAQTHALELSRNAGLRSTDVLVSKDRETVHVTVTGNAQTFIPGWGGPHVSAKVTGPVERWSRP